MDLTNILFSVIGTLSLALAGMFRLQIEAYKERILEKDAANERLVNAYKDALKTAIDDLKNMREKESEKLDDLVRSLDASTTVGENTLKVLNYISNEK